MSPLSVQFRVMRQLEATTENSWKVSSPSPSPALSPVPAPQLRWRFAIGFRPKWVIAKYTDINRH